MRYILVFFVMVSFFLLFLVSCTLQVRNPFPIPRVKTKVIVGRFSVPSDELFLSAVAREMVRQYLSKAGYTVLEREDLKDLINEYKLQLVGLVKENNWGEIGKLANADMILTGDVKRLNDSFVFHYRMFSVRTGEVALTGDISLARSDPRIEKYRQSISMPLPPVDLKAISREGIIELRWSDKNSDTLWYEIFRDSGDGKYVHVNTVTERQYTDTDVIPFVRYSYKVYAVSIFALRSERSARVSGMAFELPDIPKGVNASLEGGDVFLTWNRCEYADGYNVYRKHDDEDWRLVGTVKDGFLMDKGVKAGMVYTYRVEAYNDYGKRSTSPITVATPPLPPTVRLVSNEEQVSLSFECGGEIRPDRFVIYRGGEEIGETMNNTYTDADVIPGIPYEYRVVAISGKSKSKPSEKIVVTPYSIVGEVKNLKAQYSDGDVILSWDKLPNLDLLGYRVTRDGKVVYDGKANAFVDNDVAMDSEYIYRVKGYNAEMSGTPAEVKVFTPPFEVTNLRVVDDYEKITLRWESRNRDLDEYIILRDGREIGESKAKSYTDTQMKLWIPHVYEVIAVWQGNRSNGIYITATAGKEPESPANVCGEISANILILQWDKVSHAEGYRIYLKKDGDWHQIADTTDNTYYSTEYGEGRYEICAYNSYGESKPVEIDVKE